MSSLLEQTPPQPVPPSESDGIERKTKWFDDNIDTFALLAEGVERMSFALSVLLDPLRPRFCEYDGKLHDGLIKMIRAIKAVLSIKRNVISRAKPHFTLGVPYSEDLMDEINRSEESRMLLGYFTMACDDNQRMSDEMFDSIIEGWYSELDSGLEHTNKLLNSIKIEIEMSAEECDILKDEVNKAQQFLNRSFMDIFITLLRQGMRMVGNDAYPFFFNCAPSGCGKTTFAMNLCQTDIPTFFWLFETPKCQAECQPVYRPFLSISYALKRAISMDISEWEEKNGTIHDPSSIDTATLEIEEHYMKPLWTVGLIVNIFEQMSNLKTSCPDLSWIDCQSRITTLHTSKMSIKKGKERLSGTAFGKKATGLPLCSFIDESSLMRVNADRSPHTAGRAELTFVRSVLRVLHVMPIFAGTDARASNFCSPDGTGTRESGLAMFWSCVFDDFPSFNSDVFKSRRGGILASVENTSSHSAISYILDFLDAVRIFENPWLIGLALDFFESYDISQNKSPPEILDELLNALSREFLYRKRMPKFFNAGQIAYIFSYDLHDSTLTANPADETSINGHLAYLKAYAHQPGEPYFLLKSQDLKPKYFENIVGSQTFVPRSYFRHFMEAPLTGLFLFRLNVNHTLYWNQTPFVESALPRYYARETTSAAISINSAKSTAFTAIHNRFDVLPCPMKEKILKRNPSGAHLEFLFHVSAIVASRSNGVVGSPFPLFLRRLLHEFCDSAYAELPALQCSAHFEDTIVPILAPMQSPAWPTSVVKLLEGLMGHSVRLGTLGVSTSNDSVDSIIYRVDGSANTLDLLDVEKKYGYHPIVKFDSSNIGFSQKVLVCECKQYKNAMTLGKIKDEIVDHKFKHHTDCKLFIVLLMDFNTNYKPKTVRAMNANGYHLWSLDSIADRHFKLAPLLQDQKVHYKIQKDVVIISMKNVWGAEKLSKVHNAWGAKIKDKSQDDIDHLHVDEIYADLKKIEDRLMKEEQDLKTCLETN